MAQAVEQLQALTEDWTREPGRAAGLKALASRPALMQGLVQVNLCCCKLKSQLAYAVPEADSAAAGLGHVSACLGMPASILLAPAAASSVPHCHAAKPPTSAIV